MNSSFIDTSTLPTKHSFPLWMRIGFWICIVIAIAVVLRRVLALAYPPRSAPPQMAALDKVFASHDALTLAHILPALAFVIITPFLYMRRRARGQKNCCFPWELWLASPLMR